MLLPRNACNVVTSCHAALRAVRAPALFCRPRLLGCRQPQISCALVYTSNSAEVLPTLMGGVLQWVQALLLTESW